MSPRGRRSVPNTGSARKRPTREPIPDLWEVPGTHMPSGNPNIDKHKPELTYIIVADGKQVCVVKSVIKSFKASGVGIEEIVKSRIPQLAPELWVGQRHVMATNALRLLQACSATFSGQNDRPDERRIFPGINPRDLLVHCGAKPHIATAIIEELLAQKLLTGSPTKRCWFVNTKVKGLLPNGVHLRREQLPDTLVLPEVAATGQVVVQPEPAAPAGAVAVSAVDTPAVEAEPETPGEEVEWTYDRHDGVFLTKVLLALKEVAEPSDQEGWMEVKVEGGIYRLLSSKLQFSKTKCAHAIAMLKALGVVTLIPAGPGPPKVSVKADVTKLTDKQANRARMRLASSKYRPRRVPVAAVPAAPKEESASEEAVSAGPEALQRMLARISADMMVLDAEVERLRAENTGLAARNAKLVERVDELIKELEAAKTASTPKVEVPKLLRRYLTE